MKTTRFGFLLLLGLLVAPLIVGCGDDDDPIQPPPGENEPPVITQLLCAEELLTGGGTASVSCTASDPDEDELTYAWTSDGGTFSETGANVIWTAPDHDGIYTLTVTVNDGREGSADLSTEVSVIAGTFLLRTRDGLLALDVNGEGFVLNESTAPVDVLGAQIFSGWGTTIRELDHNGEIIRSIVAPAGMPGMGDFVALPGERIAGLNNNENTIGIFDFDGEEIITLTMLEPGGSLQNVNGVVVDDRLIVSENGTSKILEVDLNTYDQSIFRDVGNDHGWLGDIDHEDDTFYLTRWDRLQRFTEGGDIEDLAVFDNGNVVAVSVVDRYAFAVLNFDSTMYRIRISDGEKVVLRDSLDYPQDIEYLEVSLSPPPGH